MRTLRLLSVFIFSIALIPGFSQQAANDRLPMDPKVLQGRLDNGLTYYIRENKKPEQKVELRLVVKVGSIMEDDDQQGLAHMAEHMAFNGTKHFKKNEIVSFLQDIGVGFGNDLNAYTSFDETVYILPIPTSKPGNVEKGFQVLEDWAHLVTYLDEDINSERAIILEESRSGKSGEERMFKQVYPELFKGSRYAERLPIGKDSIIRNFKPDAIRRFYRDWYRPELMAVVVVGDIPQQQALALVKKHFAGLKNPANPRPRTYAAVPTYSQRKSMVVTDKEATSYDFAIQFSARPEPPLTTFGAFREEIIRDLYTSMLNARFRELSQGEQPPFVYAFADFSSLARNHSAFGVSASTGTNDVRKGMDAVYREIERVKRHGFTAAELDRAKKNLLSNYERAFNNRDKTESSDLTEECVQHFTNEDGMPGIETEYAYVKATLPAIPIDELNKITESLRKEKDFFSFVMGPESTPGITLPAKDELIKAYDAQSQAAVGPYEEKEVAARLMDELPVKGKITGRKSDATLGTTELTLSNGITVTLKQTDFKSDQVLMSGFRYGGFGGYALADKYSAENATMMASSMGIGNFTPTNLRKVLAGKTASMSPVISDTEDGFRGSSSNKDMETMFQVLYLQVTAPRKDSALFKSTIQRNKAQFLMMGANPQFSFIDTTFQVLFQRNPLAPTAVPKAENFDKINLDRSLAIYRERLGDATGMHFTIVGSIKEEILLPLIETYLASLPTSGRKTNYTDNKVRWVKGPQQFEFRKGKEEKSLVLGIFAGEMPYSYTMARKFNALSEVLNILIIEEMREKIQGIYGGGTSVQMTKAPYPSFQFILQLPCGPEKADTLLKEFRRELSKLADQGPDQKYLDKVKKQWLESYRTEVKTNEFWLSKLGQLRKGETSAAQFLSWEKDVNAMSTADVKEAARVVSQGTTQLVGVLMPEKK